MTSLDYFTILVRLFRGAESLDLLVTCSCIGFQELKVLFVALIFQNVFVFFHLKTATGTKMAAL